MNCRSSLVHVALVPWTSVFREMGAEGINLTLFVLIFKRGPNAVYSEERNDN